MNARLLVLLLFLVGLQGLDIVVHLATDQLEPLRITSNVIISIAAITAVFIAFSQSRSIIFFAGAAYLVLNMVFLAQHGLINPASGALRMPLFGFVIGSLALLEWFRRCLMSLSR